MAEKTGARIRQPIIVVMGHVDHGKTTLLDKIRGTAVAKKEPGEITQHVGASIVPASVLERISKPLRKYFPKLTIEIPGLLFIDTPGHELFSNLRMRGGSVADMAILVIDVIEGFQPQTVEALNILKEKRVPFVVAANKVDKLPGWTPFPDSPILESLSRQNARVVGMLDEKIYSLVGEFYKYGFEAERFDRVRDFRKTVAIVPVSAKTGEGIPELLALIAGLSQQFMKKKLVTTDDHGKGVVLEVKEEPGLGTTIDVIVYDGVVRRNDLFVIAGKNGPIVSRIRSLLMPRPLQDMRMHEGGFTQVDAVYAATGVKISAPGLEDAVAGSPFYVIPNEQLVDQYTQLVKEEVATIVFRGESDGVIVKADTLGTLEAVVEALRRSGIPVKVADVGHVTRNDVIEASVVKTSKPELGVILAFNVKVLPEAEELALKEDVKIFRHNIIYQLVDEFLKWYREFKEKALQSELENLVRPGKIRILPGFVFRRSDPAIVGVEVLEGTIRSGYPLMKDDGEDIGTIMQIRDRDNVLKEAKSGQQVAISIKGKVLVGRHIDEGDVLYTSVPATHVKVWLSKYKTHLSESELKALEEIIKIKRNKDPFYGLILGK